MEPISGNDKTPKLYPHRPTMPILRLCANSLNSLNSPKEKNHPENNLKKTQSPRRLSITGKNNRLTVNSRKSRVKHENRPKSTKNFAYLLNKPKQSIKSNVKNLLNIPQKVNKSRAIKQKSFNFPSPNFDQRPSFMDMKNNQSTIEKVQMYENFEIENIEKDVQQKLVDMSIIIQNPKKKNNKHYVKEINNIIINNKKRKSNNSNKDVSIFSKNLNKIDDFSQKKNKSSKNIFLAVDNNYNDKSINNSLCKIESYKGSLEKENNNTLVKNSLKPTNSSQIEEEIIKIIKISKEEKKYRKIERKKLIYDSIEEDESEEEEILEGVYISPDSDFIFSLDLIILICSLFCIIYLPIQLARCRCFCIDINLFITYFQFLIDALFIFDFLINFYRGYYKNENLVKNNQLIFMHYLQHNFSIDLIDSFPFFSLCYYLCKKYNPDGDFCIEGNLSGKYTTLKILTILKISRIYKILFCSENKVMKKIKKIISVSYSTETIMSELIFILLCLSCLHIFVCFHIFIGLKSSYNWMTITNQSNSSFSSLYITSFYFIITTMTTVGYGDIVARGMSEISFQLILLTIGIISYSYIITIMGNHFKNESRAKIKYNKNNLLLEEIRVSYPKMSFKLYSHIKHHLNSTVTEKKKCDLSILVNTLPYSLKNEILLQVYSDIKNKLKFLKPYKENTDLISKVLKCFIPLSFQKNAFIMKEGELIQNIILIKEGRLALVAAIDLDDPCGSVLKYFQIFKDFSEKEADFRKKLNLNNSITSSSHSIGKENTIKRELTYAINPKFHQSFGVSYMHETFLEEEIDKYNLQNDDVEEGNFSFINILNLYKNENYGIYSMLINKPNPLSLKVKSKKVDIFLFRKKDAIKIFKAYPELYETASKNAFDNMISVKNKTIKEVKKFCDQHGIEYETPVDLVTQRQEKYDIVNFVPFDELVKLENTRLETRKLERTISRKSRKSRDMIKRGKTMKDMLNKMISKTKCQSSNSIRNSKILNRAKTNYRKKNDKNSNQKLSAKITLKNSSLSNKINSFDNKSKVNNYSGNNFRRGSLNSILTFNDKKNDKKIKNPTAESRKFSFFGNNEEEFVFKSKFNKEIKTNSNNEINSSKKNIISNENLNSFDNQFFKESNKTIKTTPLLDNDNENPGTLKSIFSGDYIKKIEKKIKSKERSKTFYKNLCLKLILSFKNFVSNHNPNNSFVNNITFGGDNSIINNITNPVYNTIIQIPQIEKFLKVKENSSNSNSSQNSGLENQKSQQFDSNKCQISQGDSFQYNGLYKNLNKISDKLYNEKDLKQKNIEKKIQSYCKGIVKKIIIKKIYYKKPKFKQTGKSSIHMSSASSFNRCSLSSDSYESPYFSSESDSENNQSEKYRKEFEDYSNTSSSKNTKNNEPKTKKRKRRKKDTSVTNATRIKKRKHNNKKNNRREKNSLIGNEIK